MKRFVVILLVGLCVCTGSVAQQSQPQRVPVAFRAAGLPTVSSEIVVRDSVPYLPAIEMLRYVGIKTVYDSLENRIDGFFNSPDTSYVIDFAGRTAVIDDRASAFGDNDFVFSRGLPYLRLGFLNDFFGLDFAFSHRRLTVSIGRSRYLPAVRYVAAQRRAAQALGRAKAIPAPDYIVDRDPLKTGAGLLNYNVLGEYSARQDFTSRYQFNLGSKVIGGDLWLVVRGFTAPRFHRSPTVRGLWRLPFPGNTTIQQITLGRFNPQGIFNVNANGVEITNRPLAERYIFSQETFQGQFTPDANVQVTGGLTGFELQRTDASGRYQFDVPVLYGRGELDIRAFDRFGETQMSRYQLNLPRRMIPPGQSEYTIFAGRIASDDDRFLSVNSISLGITNRFTVGGRLDFYNENTPQKLFGGLTTTAQILRPLLFDALVSPGAYSHFGLDWLPSSVGEISLDRYLYASSSPFNFTGVQNEWDLTVNMPLEPRNLVRASVLGVQSDYASYHERNLQASISGTFQNFLPSVGTLVVWRKLAGQDATTIPIHLSDLSFSALLPQRVLLRAGLTYNHAASNVQSVRADISKFFSGRLYVNFSYESIPYASVWLVGLQLRYVFPFVDARATVRHNNTQTTFGMNVIGSMNFDVSSRYLRFLGQFSGRGMSGFDVNPFLDRNDNGVIDPGEPSIDKGRIYYRDLTKETSPVPLRRNTFESPRLNSYEDYVIYLDPQSLDDPMLVPKYASVRMLTEADYVKGVDLPIVYSGTIRGSVVLVTDTTRKPLEGITVMYTAVTTIKTTTSKTTQKTSTFSTGEYEFASLRPGKYLIELDANQLATLGVTADSMSKEVTIVSKPDGDTVGDVNFVLSPR